MWLLYKTWIGQLLLRLPLTWWILTWQHHRIARYANSPKSKESVKPFIKVNIMLYPQLAATKLFCGEPVLRSLGGLQASIANPGGDLSD
jgi:hypothetical protein